MNNLQLFFEQLETLQPVGRLLPLYVQLLMFGYSFIYLDNNRQIQVLLENLPRLTEKELVSSGHRGINHSPPPQLSIDIHTCQIRFAQYA